MNEGFDPKNINGAKVELPLIEISEAREGVPTSFFAYHGSSQPFMTVIPSEKIPVVFYADKPEVAATYPWGKFLNELVDEANKDREDSELTIAMKLLVTEELDKYPFTKNLISPMRLYDYNMQEPSVIAVKKKLETDPELRVRAEKLIMANDAFSAARRVGKKDVLDYEMGPLGSVREYLISSNNPAVVDFEGHTWGDLPNEEKPGAWLVPSRRATTEDLRPSWDAWLQKFFDKGHDVIVINNIRDVGDNIDGISPLHTTIAVSTKAKVEMKKEL